MKFCIKCDNMYYIGVDADDHNKLIHYCRNCKYKDETLTSEGACVLNSQLKKGEQKFNHIINKYTKLDPTLPRIYNVKCPNVECKTNKGTEPRVGLAEPKVGLAEPRVGLAEVIYVRYDDDQLKYLYICSECDTTWKTNDKR